MVPLVIANWKMQFDDATAVDTARRLVDTLSEGPEVVLCPSFTALARVADALRGSSVLLGAQDCATTKRGAFTGEVSPDDLIALGCRYVILGHSERRQYCGETDTTIAQKVCAALSSGLRPILCVGETADERRMGQREAVIDRQLRGALRGLSLIGSQQLAIAYEPVWAIGTKHAAKPEDAAQAHAFIIETVRGCVGTSSAQQLRILYGGSVDPKNVRSFLDQPHVHGVLAGTAGQTPARLRTLVAAAAVQKSKS